jgi:hypothetical protein
MNFNDEIMISPLKKLEVIIFCSVQFLSKKSNPTEFKKKTKTKTGSN